MGDRHWVALFRVRRGRRHRPAGRPSSASSSSTVGRLPFRLAGSFSRSLYAETPMALLHVPQRVLDDDLVLLFAEHEAEARLVPLDHEMHLAANEREADAELEQEVAHALHESALKVALLRIRPESQEVEDVRVLLGLLGEVRVRWRERRLEIRERLASSRVQAGLNLGEEPVARPAVLDGLTRVP